MKSLQFADAGPRIKSASSWRSIGAAFLTVVFCLGMAVTLEAKKPVKPPPEPPPETEGGVIYFGLNEGWDPSPSWVCQMNPDGTNMIPLFEATNADHKYGIAIPSIHLYDGQRLFVCSKANEYTVITEGNPTYSEQFYTSLILVDENGHELGSLIPEHHLWLGFGSIVVWYANDSKLAILACRIEVEEVGTYPTIRFDDTTMGIYLVDLTLNPNGTPTVSPPVLLEWTTDVALVPSSQGSFFPETCIDSFDILTIESGSDLIYLSKWDDPGTKDAALFEAELDFGGLDMLSTSEFTNLRLHPDGSVLIGNNGSVAMVKYYLDSQADEPEVDLLRSKKNLRGWGGAVWSPSGENISFGQLGQNFFPVIVRATADAKDVTAIFSSSPDGSCGAPFAWRATP